MTPWLNYHHLFYFKCIAEEGSVSAAAIKLRIGQPTLSAQLKQFEDQIGIQLFERRNKKLILTEQGKIAFDYSKNIFKLGSEMYEVLHHRMVPLKNTLHIGALDSIPKQLIVQLVKYAYKISPCQITLSEGSSEMLLRELSQHRIDLMVTDKIPSGVDAKGLVPKSISKKNVAFFGAQKFVGLRKNFPNSISDVPIIFPTYDSRMRQDLEHWAKTYSISLNIIAESQDISVKKLMAISGMGLIAAATHTVTRQVLGGELVEIGKLRNVSEELFLMTAQRKIENSVALRIMSGFSL
jgi:LysR family transcriptional activator of nhaA